MGPENTGITNYGPRNASLGPAPSLSKFSLRPATGRYKLFRGTAMGPIKLSKIFERGITYRIFAGAPDNLCSSKSYKPTKPKNWVEILAEMFLQ